jgi:small-conductance mechanosensitive channel
VARELRRRIKQVFDEQDIEIPVPHIAIEDARHAKSLS